MTRVCVVTPFFREADAVLERCIQSVASQTVACDHIMVGDGVSLPTSLRNGVRFLPLDVSHSDYGNTPRGVGGVLAAAEGYDAVAFLDADNWFDPDHIEYCLSTRSGTTDAALARRRIYTIDGKLLPGPDEPIDQHCDTSCFFLFRGAFFLIPVWAMIPRYLSDQGDRIFYNRLKSKRLELKILDRPTVNYTTHAVKSYLYAGLEPPPEAHNLDFSVGQKHLAAEPARERQSAWRMMSGFCVDPALSDFDRGCPPRSGSKVSIGQTVRSVEDALAATARRQGCGEGESLMRELRISELLSDAIAARESLVLYRKLGGEERYRLSSVLSLPAELPLRSDGTEIGDKVLSLVLLRILRVASAIRTSSPLISALATRFGVEVCG